MTQDEMKKTAGWAALKYVEKDSIVGVGTGSTVNHFIDAPQNQTKSCTNDNRNNHILA